MLILPANSLTGGYEIANSLRFDDGSSDYLTKTFGSAGDRKTWTWSGWVKRSTLGTQQDFFSVSSGASTFHILYFDSNDQLTYNYNSSNIINTTRVFRDLSAWYHIVIAQDTTQATSSDRVKIWINGVQETVFDSSPTYPSLNADLGINNNVRHDISNGGAYYNNNFYIDGYMSEINFIDGQALDPTSFGEFDEDSGIWKPIKYTGTYGTNGFYLDFENSGSLGTDQSGNGNNFTVNNLTSIDQTTDTPTNNFATMNPLDNYWQSSTFTQGNLQVQTSNTQYSPNYATMGVSKGKWYWEVKVTAQSDSGVLPMIGVASTQCTSASQELGYSANDYGFATFSGNIRTNSTNNSYGNAISLGDIVGVALDLDNNTIKFYINGTVQNSGTAYSITASSSTVLGNYFPAYGDYSSSNNTTAQFNFGNPPYTANGYTDGAGYGNFSYSVPSGYYALCTKNLAEYG